MYTYIDALYAPLHLRRLFLHRLLPALPPPGDMPLFRDSSRFECFITQGKVYT